ncbi:MAG TPA: D-alanyl-D-alanine carboxypeptidase/D-alanyl-D-alanine-endopeptidase [Ignavibacteriaceae bacterium]|nr:D-alanyl-D-alanine carboxypeptidase/D-alanyl-D-alanine-endopeptidase [Ignavibacteriaceae bacterium]
MIKKSIVISLLFIINLFPSTPEKIQKQIEDILKELPSSTKVALLIINPLTLDTIYQVNAARSMIPASNTKLFTTATALSLFGGNFKLSTKILTDDDELSDSVINGNIYIKGFGNSLFTSNDLDSLVDVIRGMGIKKITGNVIGDDTYFDNIYSRKDWIENEKANVRLPPISALVVNGNKKIIYRKRRGRLRAYYTNVTNPPLYIAQLLKEKLEKADIVSEGNAQKGITPDSTNFLTESYILLKDLIKETNKHSNNFLAECLFKTIGAETSGKQGNSFYSTQAVLGFIDDNGIFSKGTSIVDGSGISRFDQITVGAIAGVLEKMYFDLKHFKDYYNSLSIAGVDGTLDERMRNTKAENNFHGKTGTLNGVTSLSGYLTTDSGDEIIVSMIFEFSRGGTNFHRRIEDKIVETLTSFE